MRYTRLRRAIESGTLIGTHGTPFQGGGNKTAQPEQKRKKLSDGSDEEPTPARKRTKSRSLLRPQDTARPRCLEEKTQPSNNSGPPTLKGPQDATKTDMLTIKAEAFGTRTFYSEGLLREHMNTSQTLPAQAPSNFSQPGKSSFSRSGPHSQMPRQSTFPLPLPHSTLIGRSPDIGYQIISTPRTPRPLPKQDGSNPTADSTTANSATSAHIPQAISVVFNTEDEDAKAFHGSPFLI